MVNVIKMKNPAPGRMVGNLHVQIDGHGSPVVVLEAGIAASSLSWSLVQKKIAEFTTVVSYDRAGFGWSQAASMRCTAANAACQLRAMLKRLEVPGPYVLVGHSFGGLIARRFQQQYPKAVAGLVLVDPVLRSEWRQPDVNTRRKLAHGVHLSRRGAMLARLGIVGLTLKLLVTGSQRIPKLMARATAGKGAGVTDRLVGEVRKMPQEHWPAIAAHWSRSSSFLAMAEYLENLPLSTSHLDERRSLDDLPTVILSAKPQPEHEHDAALSTRGQNIVVPNSGHWILLDAPAAVVEAVRRVVLQVRTQ